MLPGLVLSPWLVGHAGDLLVAGVWGSCPEAAAASASRDDTWVRPGASPFPPWGQALEAHESGEGAGVPHLLRGSCDCEAAAQGSWVLGSPGRTHRPAHKTEAGPWILGMGCVLCEHQGIRLRSKNKNLKTGTFLELCQGRSPELRGAGGVRAGEARLCVFQNKTW